MKMQSWLGVVGLGAALLTAGGCDVARLQAAGVDGTFERTLTVTGPIDLDVRTGSGEIQIRPGPGNSVRIAARVRAESTIGGAAAEQRVAQIQANPPIEQTGNSIRIGVTHNDPLYRNVQISYEVTVPAQTKVAARSGSGNIGIALTAEAVDARTGSGDINVLGASGSFEAHTGSGNVRVGRVAGALKASTGSGNIEAGQAAPQEVEMRTGSGDVSLGMADEAAFTVNVHTGSGSIRTTHPITLNGSHGRNRLEGTVRGGGPTVFIRTGSGSVSIN
jgi:hypothetical protein